MTYPGLDSATPPSAAQADAARAAGYRIWSGYIATRGGVNLLNAWSQADFENARRCGSMPIAYCSGWDDPAALRQLAAAWNVRLCLDDESGIRPDGAWVQPWLDASGAGLYGNWWVHPGRSAAFHILSAYPTSGDPFGDSWWSQSPRPAGPCGWQWAGSHFEFGLDVDSTWFDDWFGGPFMALTDAQQQQVYDWLQNLVAWKDDDGDPLLRDIQKAASTGTGLTGNIIAQILAAVRTPPAVDVNALAAALATHPLTATLSDPERDAVAQHVLQHLSKDAAAG